MKRLETRSVTGWCAEIACRSFYLLPKVHKSLSSPPGWPIVSSNGCPTERISAFVDTMSKPLITNVPSFIRDTKQLLSKILALPKLPSHALLVTTVVLGLYSKIPHSDGADAYREHQAQRPVCVPATEDVLKLTGLVLDMNCLTFQENTTVRFSERRWAPAWHRALPISSGLVLEKKMPAARIPSVLFYHANRAHSSI